MRREGKTRGHRTNHTVRTTTCGPGFKECYVVPGHCTAAINAAWDYTHSSKPGIRISRLDQFRDTQKVYELTGPGRSKRLNCGMDVCARKKHRCYSYESDEKQARKRSINRFIADELQFDY